MRRKIARIMAILCVTACLYTNVCAVEVNDTPAESMLSARATGSFSTEIKAGKLITVGSALPLAAGEKVRIQASYIPFNASVDFGLVDEAGTFYYANVTTGSIDKTIIIRENGNYTFAIRNNANVTIAVTGTVQY